MAETLVLFYTSILLATVGCLSVIEPAMFLNETLKPDGEGYSEVHNKVWIPQVAVSLLMFCAQSSGHSCACEGRLVLH